MHGLQRVFGRGTRPPAAASAVRTSGMADAQLIYGDNHFRRIKLAQANMAIVWYSWLRTDLTSG
jgi:hypothetical protein